MMRLSEAIRLGALLRPKAIGYFFKDGASCAQGAALEATGTRYDNNPELSLFYHGMMVTRWPWIRKGAWCPACGLYAPVGGVIPHLNNRLGAHDWPRERIADWVETVEPADACPSAPEAVDASDPHAVDQGNLATRV